MKSKKAEEFNPNTEKNRQLLISAIQGEEKMREKAIETHLNNCPHLYDRNCDISENGMCGYRSGVKCRYMTKFIEQLNQ